MPVVDCQTSFGMEQGHAQGAAPPIHDVAWEATSHGRGSPLWVPWLK